MIIEEAEKIIEKYMDGLGPNLDAGDVELFNALYMSLDGLKALRTLREIKQIIDAPIYLQEDVWRYKAVCEVVKGVIGE